MHIDIIDDIETLRRYKDEWCLVYDADPEAHGFLSWPWMSSWLEWINDPWLVLAAKPDAQATSYVAFFPIQLWSAVNAETGFFNTLCMGGAALAGFTGFLCDPAYEDDSMPAFSKACLDLCWTSLHLDRVAVSQERLTLFLDGFGGSDFKVVTPDHKLTDEAIDNSVNCYVELPGDWDDYLSNQLGRNTRRNARTYMKLLDGGDLRVTHATDDTMERDIDILLDFWEIKWAPSKDERKLNYLLKNNRAMIRSGFQSGTILLLVLWQGGKPTGAQATWIDHRKRTLICLVGARDLSVRKPSPGFVLHFYSIRWAIQNEFKIYDLQLGDDSYKYDFGPKERRLQNRIVSTRDTGNFHGRLDTRSLPVVLALAHEYYETGQYEIASIGCQQILQADPGHTGASGLLKAIEESAPSATAEALDQARDLAQQGETEEATRILDTILNSEPRNFDARYLLGLICLKQNQFEAAERHIRQAITINGRVAATHYNFGLALKGLGRTTKALKSFKKAIALRPDYPQAHNALGEVLRTMGRHAEALKSFNQALSLQPGFTPARKNLNGPTGSTNRRT